MKIFKIDEEKETKLINHLKSNRVEFLKRLLKEIEERDCEKVVFHKDFLHLLLLKESTVDNSDNNDNEYSECKEDFFDLKCSYTLEKICNYLDFSNLEYKNLELSNSNLNFLKQYNIPIYLDGIYHKDLSLLDLENLVFIGSFDNCKLNHTKFKNNKDQYGKRIKINPQKIKDKKISSCSFEDVEFIGNFDGVNFIPCGSEETSIKNCTNVIINPQNLYNKDLSSCYFDGVEFTGNFDDCNIYKIAIINSKNAKINPQKVHDKDLFACYFDGVEFTGNFDNCCITSIKIKNSKGVKINPQKIKDRDLRWIKIDGGEFTDSIDHCEMEDATLSNVSNVFLHAENINLMGYYFSDKKFNCTQFTIYVTNEHGIYELIEYRRSIYCDHTTTIVCNLTSKERLLQCKQFKDCNFKLLHLQMDDDLDEAFNQSSEVKCDTQSSKVKYDIKKKKKSFFDRFRRNK